MTFDPVSYRAATTLKAQRPAFYLEPFTVANSGEGRPNLLLLGVLKPVGRILHLIDIDARRITEIPREDSSPPSPAKIRILCESGLST
jgi:hypothetical protein